MRTVYPVTRELIEWLNGTLYPIEASVFRHYRSLIHLIRIVDRAEAGRVPKYAALSAIREHNERTGTAVTYEEVRDRSPTYVFAEIGDWAAYVNTPEATNVVVSGPYDDPMEALEGAPEEVTWIILWLPQDDVVIVLRSPVMAERDVLEGTEMADGLRRGPFIAPALPPEIVASLGRSTDADTESWREADACRSGIDVLHPDRALARSGDVLW